MEKNHLIEFEVKGFKKFTDLSVTDIGQFNLIVGDNNTGKTTLLEALLADKDADKFHEYLEDILHHVKRFSDITDRFFSYYFSDSQEKFPQKIFFTLTNSDLNFETIKYSRINENQILRHYLKNSHSSEDDNGDQIGFHRQNNRTFNYNSPFIPFGPLYSDELTKIYGKNIQLYVDKKERLIDSLSHLIQNISNIEVSASYTFNPVLLISEKNKNRLSPLATYGDGTLKLFRILLSLFSTQHYSRLMVDEIDAGVHYSRLKGFFKSLLLVAKDQGRQIFATTHSKECIESFTEALKELEYESDGRIIRLAETKSGIKAYTMKFEEFQNSLDAESEIR